VKVKRKQQKKKSKGKSVNLFEASASSSAGDSEIEVHEVIEQPTSKRRKGKKKVVALKEEVLDVGKKSLYTKMLENQMERENIILLHTLLHFREHGILDLE
jgi:hypothetical protein